MKRLILLFIFLALIPSVIAFTDGQTFNQNQIDSYNVSTLTKEDLDLHPTGYSTYRYLLYINFDYLDIFPDGNGYRAQYVSGRISISAYDIVKGCLKPTKLQIFTCVRDEIVPDKTDLFLDYVKGNVLFYNSEIKGELISWVEEWIASY